MSSLIFNNSSSSLMFNNSSSSLMFNNSSLSLPTNSFRQEIKEYLANVNYIVSFVQLFISIMGVLGNLLALIVINRKPLRNTSSAVFITYMAIFDSAVLLFHGLNLVKPRRNLLLHCSLTYLTDLSTFCANWVLVIITLERCVAVYFPFLAKRLCTIHSARHSMYILLTTSIIFFSITFPFIYEKNEPLKSPKCVVRRNAGLILRIYQPILFYAIPDFLILSNLFIVFALCRRQDRLASIFLNNNEKCEIRINDVHSNRKQRQLTVMLVTVSLSFYLFTTPAMVAFITEYHTPQHRDIKKIKQTILFSQVSVVLLQLHNATNFIFYCLAGQRFRHVTAETFHCYSKQLKQFYHQYILCDKQYQSIPFYQYHLNFMGNTTATTHSSCSPHIHRHQYKTSTI